MLKFKVVLFVLVMALINPVQARVSTGAALLGAAAVGTAAYAIGKSNSETVIKEVPVIQETKTKNSILLCKSRDGLLCAYDKKTWTPAQWAKRGGYRYIVRVETLHTGGWPEEYTLRIEVSN